MKKSLMRGFVLIVLAALLISGVFNALAFNSQLLDETKNEMYSLAKLVSKGFDPSVSADEQARLYAELISNVRVTVISADGTVLGDSQADYKAMRNHLDAPEIIRARVSGFGTSVRSSQTIGKKLVYAAVSRNDGIFIRVAGEVAGVADSILSIVPIMIIAVIAVLILSVLMTNRFSNRFVKPIIKMSDSIIAVKDGRAELDPNSYKYAELAEIAVKVNSIAKELSAHIGTIKQEKDKLTYILDNVGEGFILLDAQQNVLIINSMACSYFNCDKSVISQNLVRAVRNYDFLQTVQAVLGGKTRQPLDIEFEGRIVETHFMRVTEESGFSAALIVTMTDVTDSRKAGVMRREFFSNASHELKTPITSIKGSAELLCTDLPIPDEQKHELLGRIGIESERMYMLINDIIMINRMESGDIPSEAYVIIDLPHVIDDCISEIKTLADKQEIAINTQLDNVQIPGDLKNVRSLFSNLIVNAVKYNKPKGAVDIELSDADDTIVFTIRNYGEPIPPAQQGRVFERFYRVDSGRSRSVGGTGLGLSIVKHIVDAMGGTVMLSSDAVHGTRFTVRLPKQ